MPYAPEDLLAALTRQPLSWFHSESRQANWSSPQPRAAASSLPMACAVPGATTTTLGSGSSRVPILVTCVTGGTVMTEAIGVRPVDDAADHLELVRGGPHAGLALGRDDLGALDRRGVLDLVRLERHGLRHGLVAGARARDQDHETVDGRRVERDGDLVALLSTRPMSFSESRTVAALLTPSITGPVDHEVDRLERRDP